MGITVKNLWKAIDESDKRSLMKPIIVWPKFVMKWLARELGVPYATEIETEAIKYVESRKLVVKEARKGRMPLFSKSAESASKKRRVM